MNFGGPLLYNRETKCLNCPQKYGCVKYLDSLEKRQNIVSASTNLVSSAPNIRVEEQKVSEVKSESSELLSSITGAFEKINQDLVKQNAYLQGALASMNEELQKIKGEIAEVKATSESKEVTIPEPDDSTNEVELVTFTATKDGMTNEATDVEKALELYKKDNQTVFREKRTIFGTKKWVEEKVT